MYLFSNPHYITFSYGLVTLQFLRQIVRVVQESLEGGQLGNLAGHAGKSLYDLGFTGRFDPGNVVIGNAALLELGQGGAEYVPCCRGACRDTPEPSG